MIGRRRLRTFCTVSPRKCRRRALLRIDINNYDGSHSRNLQRWPAASSADRSRVRSVAQHRPPPASTLALAFHASLAVSRSRATASYRVCRHTYVPRGKFISRLNSSFTSSHFRVTIALVLRSTCRLCLIATTLDCVLPSVSSSAVPSGNYNTTH
jgi:hypothetical protein